MSDITLIDTSVFCNILNIPNKNSDHKNVMVELELKLEADHKLFLPMATIFETGNHIGQNGDGGVRRKCADVFTEQVIKAIEGETPFTPINFLEDKDIYQWLEEFPDHAMRGSGLGDLSIIHDWNNLCGLHRARRVYIWSLDGHLSSHDRGPEV